MKESSDGFVRADQIDLKRLDEQLDRHLSRAWTMEKKKEGAKERVSREEWEIDPSKLIIKTVIARGTFGTVHRGVYDGQDVAVKLLDWGEEGHRTETEIASLRAAFTQEVAVWHKLDHPNVTKTLRFRNININLNLVKPWIIGKRFIRLLGEKKESYPFNSAWVLMNEVNCSSYGQVAAMSLWGVAFLDYCVTPDVLKGACICGWEKMGSGGGCTEFRWRTYVIFPCKSEFIGATMGSSELNIQTDNGYIGMPSNVCCVVVEYLPGGALKSYLIKNRRRKLAFRVVVQLALDLARGSGTIQLSYLHSEKIVHRDVKTENMLLDKTRTVKIADFGVARVEASNPNDMTGETGTLGYMAPEVLNGNPYNRKCDVYSFGICLWEIYCCDMPYPDLSFSEVTSAVVRQNLRPEMPRCCPSSLANVMKRCWDANPDKRPEMDEVVSMLEAIDTSKGGGMIPVDQQQGCFCFRRHRGP
ncbi:hypothetical protein HHK36_015128 [Tetracentron sinense]|uniref:non-specific serine/threonine protein kinase n=1 Tax=Tetracentron sinense TaxID=13715 RepID=A0A834Z6M6_TETSI|nr:hypothetical protein HHK36_015128 [Tetracentron sinense]